MRFFDALVAHENAPPERARENVHALGPRLQSVSVVVLVGFVSFCKGKQTVGLVRRRQKKRERGEKRKRKRDGEKRE